METKTVETTGDRIAERKEKGKEEGWIKEQMNGLMRKLESKLACKSRLTDL